GVSCGVPSRASCSVRPPPPRSTRFPYTTLFRSEDEIAAGIAARGAIPDPDRIHEAREALAETIARDHRPALTALYERMNPPGPYSPDAGPAGRRSLRLAALGLLSRLGGGALAQALWDAAPDMTQRMGALAALVRLDRAGPALAQLESQFADNRLVMDKFFAIQPMAAPPARAVAIARSLAARPDFDWKNPNR